MRLLIFRPDPQVKGSWLFHLLLRMNRLVQWFAPATATLLGVMGVALCFLGWQVQSVYFGVGGMILIFLATGVALLWSEYDWWLFKLSPQKGLNIPLD